ncbi:hypothetical protein, conserved [Thermococcus onnurineus NA1]|uniref:DUF356 domain-containing protein n=1 Tax=Thermococcus onnurineus (strain NA1) TaxID=523850 RepID=B6YXI3_THEON|nr:MULTISPECIES: DUF356 domain-containing protein [Thermococcus]ACJ16796.1 hypothetical protein, conserved [Thermococcus onnurineus NA1]NJE46856.1 DUF356 domain-containing protein [Thermococcus sp. GR7]NJE78353.1 DUF356 domain-containing protein [Thermococcus sp. GR4]NJF23350.1 DUF356 domain-containing protein [Thermococcus sp. GR5]
MRNTMVLVRTDNFQKASIALADLVRYGGMKIRGDPRIIPPVLSDWAFEKISGEKPRKKFRAHVIAQIDLPPAKAIGRLMDIHPPAHILVIPPDTEVWEELIRMWGTFEKLKGFHPPKRTKAEKLKKKREEDLEEF